MAAVYILYSKTADEFYTGSSKDPDQRFVYHLIKEFPSSYTAKYDDWELFFKIDNLDIGVARKIEAHQEDEEQSLYPQSCKVSRDVEEIDCALSVDALSR